MADTPADPQAVTEWLHRLREGDEDAVRRLWDHYFHRLVRLAQRNLRGLPTKAVDEEDVALSAFKSFHRAAVAGNFGKLDDRDDLWRILLCLTVRKAIDTRRRSTTQRRGGRTADVVIDEAVAADLISREDDPQLRAEVDEQFERLLEALDDESMRQIALGKLQGFTNVEIAEKLGCGLRTVQRRLEIIRRTWTQAVAEE